MGTRVLLTSFRSSSTTFPFPGNGISHRFSNKTSFSTRTFRSSRYDGGRTTGANWDSNAEATIRSQRFKFDANDEQFSTPHDDYYEPTTFRSGRKRRAWWADDSVDIDDDDDDFEDEDRSGVLEGSIGIAGIFKIFRAFGWMLPAIIISMLMGTGTNTFFMALGLPLAQTVLSLVVDAVWGRSNDNPRPKTRPNKRPFARDAQNIRWNKGKEENSGKKKGRMNDQFRGAPKRPNSSTVNFGGWDELDKQEKVPQTQNANGPRLPKGGGKLSRKSRNRETPLLVRLLIALFPFMGSWTKIL